jgi:predicted nucleic acid-binding protein
MRYVLDASAALCWVLPRPNSGKALQLRADFQNAVHELIAPSIFSGEIASALTKAERQRLIPVGDARPLLGQVMRTPSVMYSYESLLDRAVDISSQTRSGLYDCLYVALAEREGVRTGDGRPKAHREPEAVFRIYCVPCVAALIRPGP